MTERLFYAIIVCSMTYTDSLKNNRFLKVLSAPDREIIFALFEYIDESQRQEAAELLERQPSLIPILIENFLKKRAAFLQGGRSAVEQEAQNDAHAVHRAFEE